VSSRRRLGVALLIDPPHSGEIDGLRRALGDRARLRIPPHVTLVAPVNVKEASLPAALTLVRAAAAACGQALQLTLGPPSTWLPDNPVLYLPVGGDRPELARLRDAVFVPPFERTLTWPWVPHVTIADDAEPARIGAAVDALGGYQVVVTIDRIVLLEERRPPLPPLPGAVLDTGMPARRRPEASWPPPGRRWVPIADALLAPAVVVGRGGVELTLVQGRLIGPDALALLEATGVDAASIDTDRPAGEHAGAIVISAITAGELVGLARAWRSDAGGQVAVAVAAEQRGAGIGRQLLRHVEDAVRRAGWHCAALHAHGPAGFYAACSDWSSVPAI
jgi:2'-5' RNA ligase/GNAT superfamily N-acetyltransferase